MDALHAFFRPELLNRIDEVVVFNRLGREEIRKIVALEVRGLEKRLRERELTLTLSEAAIDVLAEEGYDPAFGARPVRRALRKLVEDPLAVQLIAGDYKDAGGIYVDAAPKGSDTPLTFEVLPRNEGDCSS